MSKREEFTEGLKRKIDEWNEDLDKLEEKVRQADTKTKEKYNETISSLKQQVSDAKLKINDFEESSESAWEEIKDGAENSIKGIGQAFERAKSHFKD